MRKIVIPNGFLEEAAIMLKQGQNVQLYIDGQSMLPFIRGGKDKTEIVPCPTGELPRWGCFFYKWEGKYMIHRYIGREQEKYRMMGDGNLIRIETVQRSEIIGMLRYIYHPDGKTQDCLHASWLRKAQWWYRLRSLRKWLLLLWKLTNGYTKHHHNY